MISVWFERCGDIPYIPLLYPNLGVQKRSSILFLQNAFSSLSQDFVQIASSPEEADCILLPHNYSSLQGHEEYIRAQADLALRLGKKLIVFWHGDSDAPVPFNHAIVFRTSQYRSALRAHEYMMPAYAEDLLTGDAICSRQKRSGKPVIGFCGWAGYKNFKNRIGTTLNNSVCLARRILGDTHAMPRIKGITWRMRAIRHLQHSPLVDTRFLIRKSYSGHVSTIGTDADTARREYIDTLLSSDYALCVKGDGNYSYRFYEALSLGRIPVLLDTECALPLEDVIDYEDLLLRIPYHELSSLDQQVAHHYTQTSEDAFLAMQQRARTIYEQYLEVGAFLQYAVEQLPKLLS